MFGTLREKLKKWVSKNKKETIEPENKKKKISPPKKRNTKKPKSFKKQKDELEQSVEETINAPSKEGFFTKFKKRLTEEKFEEIFEELELILLQNNVAYESVQSIKNSLAEKLIGGNLKEVNLTKELKDAIESILINPPNFIKIIKDSLEVKSPFIIVFSGINGSGKTTTIAKVANYLQINYLFPLPPQILFVQHQSSKSNNTQINSMST